MGFGIRRAIGWTLAVLAALGATTIVRDYLALRDFNRQVAEEVTRIFEDDDAFRRVLEREGASREESRRILEVIRETQRHRAAASETSETRSGR